MGFKNHSNSFYEKDFLKKYSKIEHRNWIQVFKLQNTFMHRYKMAYIYILKRTLGIVT